MPGRAPRARATRPGFPPRLLASPAPRGGCLSLRCHLPVPVTTRWPLSVPRLIRTGRGSRASRAARREGRLGEGQAAGGKGRESGAETAARGGFCGRGRRRRRLGVPSARGRARERDAGGCGGGGGGRDRSGGGRARRKPQNAGGPVAGSGREPGRQRQRSRRARHRRRQRRPRGPVSVRPGGHWARAGTMEPQHVRPALAARSPAWEEPVGTAPVPTPPACPCSLPPPPLPARVPFRKRSGMRSPAASQPGQRFLRRPGSSSRAARSAFVRSAGALPRGASGDGPSRTVSALHPLPNFALHSRVWRGGSGRGGGGAARSAGGAGRRRDSPLDRALAVTWARRFLRTAAWGGE